MKVFPCNHLRAFARSMDPSRRLYCPDCGAILRESESENVRLQLLRIAAGVEKRPK